MHQRDTGLPANNIDGIQAIPAAATHRGKTIADQLFETRPHLEELSGRSPRQRCRLVNNSDGVYSNLTDFSKILPALNPPLTSAGIVNLYAAKHNPFVYFQSVQEGRIRRTEPGKHGRLRRS